MFLCIIRHSSPTWRRKGTNKRLWQYGAEVKAIGSNIITAFTPGEARNQTSVQNIEPKRILEHLVVLDLVVFDVPL